MTDAATDDRVLAALAAAGAALRARAGDGVGEVRTFGRPDAEAAALASGAGVLPRVATATWVATGRDARDYLHRVLTQDVKSLARGAARYACALTREGRILCDAVVRALAASDGRDAFALDMDVGAAVKAVPHLERFVIADDVTWARAPLAHWTLAGPAALDVVRAAGLPVPPEGEFLPARLAGADVLVLRRDLPDRPALHGIVPAGAFAACFEALRRLDGVVAVGLDAWDVARVEAGVPAWGAEIDDRRILPNEAGLDRTAISWTKGCYPGQEPVVMAKHRGHPPTLLVRLRIEGRSEVGAGDALPAPGSALLDDAGRSAGRITTAVRGARVPGAIALGFARFDSAKPGAALAVEGSASRAVVESVLA